jgi:antitoxin HicB
MRTEYSYPARIDRDEEGRYQVRFPDLPDALTDGADLAEARTEAADCLSAALASRIIDGETIPEASPPASGQELVRPAPTIALKAALYDALSRRDMTVADLADRLGAGDWHQAARLLDPRRPSKLTSLAAALDALGYRIVISVEANPAPAAAGGTSKDVIGPTYAALASGAPIVERATGVSARSLSRPPVRRTSTGAFERVGPKRRVRIPEPKKS